MYIITYNAGIKNKKDQAGTDPLPPIQANPKSQQKCFNISL